MSTLFTALEDTHSVPVPSELSIPLCIRSSSLPPAGVSLLKLQTNKHYNKEDADPLAGQVT